MERLADWVTSHNPTSPCPSAFSPSNSLSDAFAFSRSQSSKEVSPVSQLGLADGPGLPGAVPGRIVLSAWTWGAGSGGGASDSALHFSQ